MSTNTANLNKFLSQFRRNQQIVLDTAGKVINQTLQEMYKRMIDRTPVGNPALWRFPAPKDYEPGTLKKSWRISFKNTQRDAKGRFASTSGVVGSGGISMKIKSTNTRETATIYNPQPYADRVEYGWSSQAPKGMMRITVAEYTGLMDKNAAKYRIR